MQSVARGYTGSIRKILPYTFGGAVFTGLVLAAFALWYALKAENTALMICFLGSAFVFPFAYGLTIWRGFKIGEGRFFSYTKIETLSLLLTHGGILTMIYFFKGQYIGPFMFFIIVPAIINVFIVLRILRHTPKDAPVEEKIISHGLQASFYSSFTMVATYADKILLFFFLSPGAVALYAAADRIAELLRSGVQDAATALAPRFAQTSHYSDRLDMIFKISSLFSVSP